MTKEIELANTSQASLVDDFVYEWLTKRQWELSASGYAVHRLQVNGQIFTVAMHRVIMQVPSMDIEIDHKDGNRLNNQMANLRFASNTQNAYNRRPQGRTSHYKGIYWRPSKGKWYARIGINNRQFYLGEFRDEIFAAKVYDAAARFYAGEFAWTNFTGNIALSVEDIRFQKKQRKLVGLLSE